MSTLVVSEVFGPTFQGEGLHCGQRVAFVRTGGCNLHCSWCDTPYTWDASRHDLRKELTRRPAAEIAAEVLAMKPHRVVISGGEPLLHQHQPGWVKLLEDLAWAGLPVEVETNGTIEPDTITRLLVDTFNVSPKLAHAGDPVNDRIKPAVLRTYAVLARAQRAVLKVVVQTRDDVLAARRLADAVAWPLERAWVMPEGTTPEVLLERQRDLADAVLAHDLNMTTRLHVLLWGEERAR